MYINHLPVSPQSKTWASTCVRKPQLMKNLKSSELKLHCRRCYLILPSAVFIHTLICLGAGGGTCWVKSKHWPSWKFTEQAGGGGKKNLHRLPASIIVLHPGAHRGPEQRKEHPVQKSQHHDGTPIPAVRQAEIHLQNLLTYSLRNLSSCWGFFTWMCVSGFSFERITLF